MSSIAPIPVDLQAGQHLTFAPGCIIPQSFFLGAMNYRVVWGTICADNGRVLAKAEYSSQIIILDPTITPLQTLEHAYIHQLLDLILTVCGDRDLRVRDSLVTTCSHFLYQAMKSFEKRPLSDLINYTGDDNSLETTDDDFKAKDVCIVPTPPSSKEIAPSKVATSIAESERETTIIPKSVVVGGMVFPVHIEKIHSVKNGSALGKTDYARQRILIDPTLATLQITEQTFFHELIHLLFYMCGESELRMNERLVEVIAQFLYQAIMTAVPRPHKDMEEAIQQLTSKSE